MMRKFFISLIFIFILFDICVNGLSKSLWDDGISIEGTIIEIIFIGERDTIIDSWKRTIIIESKLILIVSKYVYLDYEY